MRHYIIKHVRSGTFYLRDGYGTTADRSKAHHYPADKLVGSVARWLKDGTLRLIPVRLGE